MTTSTAAEAPRGGRLRGLFVFALLAGCSSPLEVRMETDPTRVRVVAMSSHPEAHLWMALADPSGEVEVRLLGDQHREGDTITFVPRYPLSPGQRYRATLEVPGEPPRSTEYRSPDRPVHEAAMVEAIYPSADRLPANLLKFYIHFSRPMREGEAIFDRIRLLDDRGRAVGDPWRRVDLWTPDARRLTLFVNPGRIKRGVNLREEFGPVLEPGRTYTLVLTADIEDAEGQPLGRTFEKRFTATAEERERPLLDRWSLSTPKAGSVDPLVVTFPRPMDRWLVPRYLAVLDSEGRPVPGTGKVCSEETSWKFVPERAWASGAYALRADPFLEDLAGNTPSRLFEEDVKDRSSPSAPLTRPFSPR